MLKPLRFIFFKFLALGLSVGIYSLQASDLSQIEGSGCRSLLRRFGRADYLGHLIVKTEGDLIRTYTYRGTHLLGTEEYPILGSQKDVFARLNDPISMLRFLGLRFFNQGRHSAPVELLADTGGYNFLISYEIPGARSKREFKIRSFIRLQRLENKKIDDSYSLFAMQGINKADSIALRERILNKNTAHVIDMGKLKIDSKALGREMILIIDYIESSIRENPHDLFFGYAVDEYSRDFYFKLMDGSDVEWTTVKDPNGENSKYFYMISAESLLGRIEEFKRKHGL